MPPLRSRHGCDNCKRKKIKCDEQHPACANCRSAGIENCQYSTPTQDKRRRVQVQDAAPMDSTSSSPSQSHSLTPTIDESTYLVDLALLHHFCSATYLTLSDDAHVQRFMQVNLVLLAMENRFLLLAVLALTALHQLNSPSDSHHRGDDRSTIATSYHSRAVRILMGPGSGLQTAVRSNVSAAFAFSGVTVIYCLGSIHPSHPWQTRDEALYLLTHWMSLSKGIVSLFVTSIDDLIEMSRGPLAPLIQGHSDPSDFQLPPELDAILDDVGELWQAEPDATLKARRSFALHLLKLTYFKHLNGDSGSTPPSILSVVLAWPARVPRTFLSLLESGDPAALVVLAYFLVRLQAAGHNFWWIGERPRFMLKLVYRLLPSEGVWRSKVEWPRQQMCPDIPWGEL